MNVTVQQIGVNWGRDTTGLMKLVGRVGLNISASDLNHKHFSVCLQKVTCSLHKGSDALFITLIFLTQYEKVLCAVRRPVHVLSLRPSVLLFWIMVRGPVYPEWPSAHTPPILLVQSVLLSLLWVFCFFVCVLFSFLEVSVLQTIGWKLSENLFLDVCFHEAEGLSNSQFIIVYVGQFTCLTLLFGAILGCMYILYASVSTTQGCTGC